MRIVSRWSLGLATILSFSLTVGCAPPRPDSQDDQVIRASVTLDQTLIPALWYTSRADRKRAGPATVALTRAWADFREQQAATLAVSDAARRRLQDITGRIARANLAVNMNGQLARAHELLEGARRDLRQLRVDAGISYYPDPVTAYHAVLERMGQAVERQDRRVLADLTGQADSLWREVERAPLDAGLYGLSADDADYIAKMVIEERAALDRLRAAAQSDATEASLRQAVKNLRGAVAEITLTMGGIGSR